jgi:hypothetical protein
MRVRVIGSRKAKMHLECDGNQLMPRRQVKLDSPVDAPGESMPRHATTSVTSTIESSCTPVPTSVVSLRGRSAHGRREREEQTSREKKMGERLREREKERERERERVYE